MSSVRALANQAFSRAAGAPLIMGNSIRLLKDGKENYPAWLDAIRAAKRYVHFECYLINEDEAGRMFADALVAKAQEGVTVRLIYDWLGCFRKASRAFWGRLRAAGVEVRCYNPPRWDSPLGWLSRDHRKTFSVDGEVGFVTGLCIGRRWLGDPDRQIEPWRDTGIQVRGPSVAAIERAFASVWAMMGQPIPEGELISRKAPEHKGETALRIVASEPSTAGMFRVDQLVAALARDRLWLTDAYYAGTGAYVQALSAAAKDGVDVRLLVPNATDIPLLKPLSRAGYRPLLEAGVRVFEWNGPMLHAKSAVADARWSRVGSTNLNIASWFGNCEMDVVVEDESFAGLNGTVLSRRPGQCDRDRSGLQAEGERTRSAAPSSSRVAERRRIRGSRRCRCGPHWQRGRRGLHQPTGARTCRSAHDGDGRRRASDPGDSFRVLPAHPGVSARAALYLDGRSVAFPGL
ncbi:MAG: cardiolipin synthase [Chthoniobacter sp.]|nr:cardiolipin synthase [Chthoniobacter sp.]